MSSDDAEEMIAAHLDGSVPWDSAGLADAMAFVGTLEHTPEDDWPSLTPPDDTPEAREVVGALKYDLGSQLLLRLRERDPEAGMDAVIARFVRFDSAVAFIRGHAERLLADELVVMGEGGRTLFASSLVEALATLPHPHGKFVYNEVHTRALELEERGGG